MKTANLYPNSLKPIVENRARKNTLKNTKQNKRNDNKKRIKPETLCSIYDSEFIH